MDKVVQRFPELNMSTEQLSRMIQVTGLNGTQIMTLSTVDVSYERATKVVNAVTEVFQTEIPKIMKVDNVAVLHMAQLKDTPVPINPKSNQSLVVSLIVSLMVAFGIIFLLEFMDDTLKKKEDIRRVFNAPVLSVVPRMKKEKVSSIEKRSNSKQAGEVTNAFSK
jgi:capsular polysaccharide biosynthesis protein